MLVGQYRRRGLLKYSSDARPVGLALGALLLSLLPFAVHAPLPALIVLWFVSLYVRTFCPYAQHNHGHLPVFHSRALNFAYDVVLAQVTGYATSLWELQHNRGHHRNYLDPRKDVARSIDLETGRAVSRWWYATRGNFTIVLDSIAIARDERARGRHRPLRRLAAEVTVQLGITALLFACNPLMAALFIVLPNLLAGFLVWWESYVHHLNVPTTHVYDGSVTVTGKRFNVFNFNIGHHTAHHEKPTLHWSLLPERTAAIARLIPAVCVRPDPGPGGLEPTVRDEPWLVMSSRAR